MIIEDDQARPGDDQANAQAHDRARPDDAQSGDKDLLIEVLRDQLREEREANRENRRIIAGLVQRVPELEAAPEPRESPVTSSEEPGSTPAPSEKEKKQERSW